MPRTYLLSAGLARLADEMVVIALVLFVLERTDDVVLSGAAVAAYTLPSVLSGPLLGAWLDRSRRPLIALAGNLFLLAAVSLTLVFAIGRSPAPVVLGLAALAGLALPMTSGGFTSLLPGLATDLPRANSTDALLFNVAAIGAPAIAGGLSAAFGAASAMVAISALALAGGLCTLALRLPAATAAEHPPLFAAIRLGLRHLATTPPLRGATLASLLSFGAVGMLATAIPTRVVELGQQKGLAGLIWAAYECGCIVSVLALRRHLPRWRPERVVFASVALFGLTMTTWPLAASLPVLVALALLSGLAEGPKLTSTITSRQTYTPLSLLGQVSTTGVSLKIGTYALGAAAGGVLIEAHPATAVILLVAAVQFAAAGLGLLATRGTHSSQETGHPRPTGRR